MSPKSLFSTAALALAAILTACTRGADSSEPTGPGTGGEVTPGVTLKVDGPGIDRSRASAVAGLGSESRLYHHEESAWYPLTRST
jgi:hypothetical protein